MSCSRRCWQACGKNLLQAFVQCSPVTSAKLQIMGVIWVSIDVSWGSNRPNMQAWKNWFAMGAQFFR